MTADLDIRPLIADNLSKLIESTCVFAKQPALSLIAVSYAVFHWHRITEKVTDGFARNFH